jgi:predicted CXXCH cytochrome family protein
MREREGLWTGLAATAIVAAGLVLWPSGAAVAWQRDLEPEPLHALRQGGSPASRPRRSVEIPADNAALCGKCHSPCENGKIHEGLEPSPETAGPGLPLTASGRATCFTCHAPHDGGDAAGGARLRVSNLQRELCLVCHHSDSDGGPSLRIVSPLDHAIVQEERLALIGTFKGRQRETLAVRLNGVGFDLPVRDGEFFSTLRLQDGVNRIEIVRLERVLWEGEVFRGQGASSGYGRRMSGHRTESREQCRDCHDDKSRKLIADANDMGALCYGCHDRFEGKRYLHGPLAVGACLACHDPHGGYGTAHLREEQTHLCGNCHAARETTATAACSASGKDCADCHDPHQSDARYLLKGPKYTNAAPGRNAARR